MFYVLAGLGVQYTSPGSSMFVSVEATTNLKTKVDSARRTQGRGCAFTVLVLADADAEAKCGHQVCMGEMVALEQ